MTPEQQALLAQLQDIALPDPIGWWPLSHLAWVLITGFTGLLSGFIWYKIDQHRRNAYRKEAQNRLMDILNSTTTPSDKILQINKLLKQVALTYYGRHDTARLSGDAWRAFLKTNCVSIPQPEDWQKILQNAYAQKATKSELQRFADYAERWIKGHHR